MKIQKRERNDKIVTVRFTKGMHAAIKESADASEMTVSETIRWMLKEWMHENKGFDEFGELD